MLATVLCQKQTTTEHGGLSGEAAILIGGIYCSYKGRRRAAILQYEEANTHGATIIENVACFCPKMALQRCVVLCW